MGHPQTPSFRYCGQGDSVPAISGGMLCDTTGEYHWFLHWYCKLAKENWSRNNLQKSQYKLWFIDYPLVNVYITNWQITMLFMGIASPFLLYGHGFDPQMETSAPWTDPSCASQSETPFRCPRSWHGNTSAASAGGFFPHTRQVGTQRNSSIKTYVIGIINWSSSPKRGWKRGKTCQTINHNSFDGWCDITWL